jgi:hypothetical protein
MSDTNDTAAIPGTSLTSTCSVCRSSNRPGGLPGQAGQAADRADQHTRRRGDRADTPSTTAQPISTQNSRCWVTVGAAAQPQLTRPTLSYKTLSYKRETMSGRSSGRSGPASLQAPHASAPHLLQARSHPTSRTRRVASPRP